MPHNKTQQSATAPAGLYELQHTPHAGLVALIARDHEGRSLSTSYVAADFYQWLEDEGALSGHNALVQRYADHLQRARAIPYTLAIVPRTSSALPSCLPVPG